MVTVPERVRSSNFQPRSPAPIEERFHAQSPASNVRWPCLCVRKCSAIVPDWPRQNRSAGLKRSAANSLSVTAYLAWARRSPLVIEQSDVARPKGEFIWGHATSLERANALTQLAERLAVQRPGLQLLLTTGADVPAPTHERDAVIHRVLPEDSVPNAEAFLAHWKPDLCLWTGGNLQPAFIICAGRQGVPLYFVDADEKLLTKSNWRWFPDLPRSLLAQFSMIFAQTANTAKVLRRIGVKNDDMIVTGNFREGAVALPFDESVREDMAENLRGRPVWLAAMVQPSELNTVLKAHKTVSKLAHRLFLILVPENESQADAFRTALEDGDWRYSVWSERESPEETTQILLADTRGDMGLWYRLATVSLMGSSLMPGQTGRDPNEPAAHGSAIIYGPNVSRYMHSYNRYAEAGAARIVRDADTLAAALGRLIAPDQSAAMANAAWDVSSVGAHVADQIADLVQDTLDVLEAK